MKLQLLRHNNLPIIIELKDISRIIALGESIIVYYKSERKITGYMLNVIE